MEIKNDLVMCVKNHYFNAALHNVCPICGSPAAAAGNPAGGQVGSFVPTERPGMGVPPAGGAGAPPVAPAGAFTPTEAPGAGVRPVPPAAPVGAFTPTEAPQGASASGPSSAPGATVPASSWGAPGGGVNPFSSPTIIGGDLAAAGKSDPVVGWLVCVEGPLRGTDWRLHAGYNYIGREVGDIHIQGDSQISREKHATVAYYNKNHSYYVGPAEGRNIIELNGEPVFSATKLSSHDLIVIGTTKLMFVPLCCEEFTWEQEKTDA